MALIAIIFLTCFTAMAQSFTLTGTVVDEDGNPVELATVACVKQAKVSMTNLKGKFSMQLQSADSVTIRFSMVGYKTRERILHKPSGKQTLRVVLTPMAALDELVVTERRRQTSQTERLDIEDAKNNPSTTGNAVEELIQQQAGVSSHDEMSSQYNVRGGSFDENAVYINNIEVYRPFLVRSGQQEGLSVINPDMVGSIGFSTGGFEAKYGDKMSSVLDITYQQPKRNEAKAQLSLLGASGFAALVGKKWAMSHGLRYKTNKYLLGSVDTKGEYRPDFLDYQTFISYRPDSLWKIDFIGNISENHFNFVPDNRETSFGTLEEVKKMAATPCNYPILKATFLFSCLTGLRKSDIEKLTWGEIQKFGDFTRIVFKQKKTGGQEYLDISDQAAAYLGTRRNDVDRVFEGFTYGAWTSLELKRWALAAGITKNLTFHCARHTFAVMMLDLGADIYTVSKLLGHRELSTTQIYAKVLDKNKQAAVNLIPSISE